MEINANNNAYANENLNDNDSYLLSYLGGGGMSPFLKSGWSWSYSNHPNFLNFFPNKNLATITNSANLE